MAEKCGEIKSETDIYLVAQNREPTVPVPLPLDPSSLEPTASLRWSSLMVLLLLLLLFLLLLLLFLLVPLLHRIPIVLTKFMAAGLGFSGQQIWLRLQRNRTTKFRIL